MREFVRVFKIQIEEKAKIEIESTDAILQWIIRLRSHGVFEIFSRDGWKNRMGKKTWTTL